MLNIDELIKEIHLLHEELTMIMTVLGIKKLSDFKFVKKVISGETYHWLHQRNLI